MIDGGKGEEGMEVVKQPKVTRETRGPRTNHLIYIRDVIVKTMLRHKASVAFKQPVDPVRLGILNYYEFILEPMDLSTIQKRLTNRYYQSGQECLEDFQLMFCNCYVYNHPESPVVSQARDLELTLVRKLIEMEEKEQVIPDGQRMRIEGRRSTSESTLSESFESTLGEGEEKGIKLRLREMKKPEPVEEKQVIVQQQQQKKVQAPVGGGKGIRMVEVTMEEDSSSESDSSESSSSSSDEDEEEEDDESMDQWYQRNKEDRRQRLIIIQNQMNLLTQQMQAVYDEEQRDEKRYKSSKRRRGNSTGSGGGGKKKKARSSSPKVTPVKIQMVPSSSKKKTSSGGTAGEAINRMLFKMASTSTPDKAGGSSKSADKGKSKSKASDKKKSDSGKAKDKSRGSTSSSSRKSSGKSSSTKKSTSKSKSQTPAVPSTSKSTPKGLTLDKNKQMTPEVLAQLKLNFFKITESDVEEIIQMCSYYDYDEDSMEDDDDMLNIKALPYTAQWEIWDKVEKKIAKAGQVKVANPDPPAPAAVVVPALDQQETLTLHFAQSPVMSEETPTPSVDNFNPVPIPPQPVTVLISGAMQDVPANPSTAAVTQKANQDIEDDDDEDDDTLLDIY